MRCKRTGLYHRAKSDARRRRVRRTVSMLAMAEFVSQLGTLVRSRAVLRNYVSPVIAFALCAERASSGASRCPLRGRPWRCSSGVTAFVENAE
jgi:hypothetical protein